MVGGDGDSRQRGHVRNARALLRASVMVRGWLLLAGLAGLVPIASGATEARPPVRDRLSVIAAGSAAPIAQALVRRHAEALPAAKPPALDIAHVRETFERGRAAINSMPFKGQNGGQGS